MARARRILARRVDGTASTREGERIGERFGHGVGAVRRDLLTQGGTFDDLLTSQAAWVDGEMSRLYGLPAPGDPTQWTRFASFAMHARAGLRTKRRVLAAD